MKLLSDEPAERLQRLPAIRFRKRFPELLQRDRFQRRLRRDKKVPSWLDCMAFLLESSYDKRRANRRASKERKGTITETQAWVDTGYAGGCYVCSFCNLHKGPNIAGKDPTTGRLTRLFNPRKDFWSWHFTWRRGSMVGRTAIGRTTIAVLKINHPKQVELRQALIDAGQFPPRLPDEA